MEKFLSSSFGVIKHMTIVVNILKKNEFRSDGERVFKKSLSYLCNFFELDEVETVLFVSLFTLYYDYAERPVNLYIISDRFGCNPLEVLKYKDKIPVLLEKGFIEETEPPDGAFGRNFFKIPTYVCDAILSNTKIPAKSEKASYTFNNFIRQLERLGDSRVENNERIEVLFQAVENKELMHSTLEGIKRTKELVPLIQDRVLLYDVAAGMINYMRTEVEVMILVNRVTDDSMNRQAIAESIMNETHPLFALNLIQIENKSTIMESTISLTDKAFELLLGEEGKLYQKKRGDKNLKKPEAIQQKDLFYMPENEGDIKKLFGSMEKENMKKLQDRLREKKLPVGLCIMFYGAPGTGKTETVYQIAKKTGRSVFHVEIGTLRSKWYGETEQNLKKIFTDYNKMCDEAKKNDDLMPILLFNEADAVFGTRGGGGEGEGFRTDNILQNILLEEMEGIKGVMIATTNFEDNFDPAFERRFLYKIKFARPDAEVKSKIWRSNIDYLSESDAMSLAKSFDFSGGEIANIVRKITIDEVMDGIKPSKDMIFEYCKKEKIKDKSKIGFER
ncbi:MAG: ATP-binding protein [Treponema sp.]|nr:ATP-binding protein [Treponema sp.]